MELLERIGLASSYPNVVPRPENTHRHRPCFGYGAGGHAL